MASNDSIAEFIKLLTSPQSQFYAYALSLLGNGQQAQDVMQETNLALWRKADQFPPATNFAAWMMKGALRACLEKLPDRQRDWKAALP
jgi:RNA polymerase sigma-70 factor (ECF subfamily)